MENSKQIRAMRTVWVVSIAALAPLIILAGILVETNTNNASFLPLLDAFKTLSAITLGFSGATRFGLALRADNSNSLILATSLLPAMVGWMCLFLPDTPAIGILLLSVCATGAWDALSFSTNAKFFWFAKIRTVMTFLAAGAHVAVLMKLF